MSLQNLPEDALFQKLPEGLIDLDEQSILRALCGGIQDRIEDIRSYAKKFEVLFTADGTTNTVVLVTFETAYGKSVVRSLDIQDSTPEEEGTLLTAWASDQLGLDVSQITSCVFGEDLLRYVDVNTLQYLASTIGAVLYQTAAQAGDATVNKQKILNSYFPRLKIKGTALSFDVLGKLIGFDDVKMTPLWGRLSPREPNDVGSDSNSADFTEIPDYFPQQSIGVAYDPHKFRDGPYHTWSGTVSADSASTAYYSQTVNGYQPWVKVSITGSVVHPAIGSSVTLGGGSPHTKATAVAGQGLQFYALGEGEDFNGLQITFQDFNSGTDRLVAITDRLSAVKYRTSYFDLDLTLTDSHAISQFGTTTVKPNLDLQADPGLVDGLTAISPYRPWTDGSGRVDSTYKDFVYNNDGPLTTTGARSQATTSPNTTQFKTDSMQAAGQEAVQIMEEVRAATRQIRKSSTGFLNQDDADYASYIAHSTLFTIAGTTAADGIASSHPAGDYSLAVSLSDAGLMGSEMSPTSNGTLVNFVSSGVTGVYDLENHYYRFISNRDLSAEAYWIPTSSDVVGSDPGSVPVTQTFAAFGDNTGNHNSYLVGNMITGWNPDFLLMLGDHNYTGDATKYADENRAFLPWINYGKAIAVPGNHDIDIEKGAAFYRFFKMDRRFYDKRIGNVHVFAIDDGLNTAEASIYPEGTGVGCDAAVWLKEALSASQAPWKVVILHHDPFISANNGHTTYPRVRWPFKDWGADIVLFGHVHAYEHMYVQDPESHNNGIHMLCIGFGGFGLRSFTGGASFGSLFRFPISPATPVAGATKFTVTATTFQWDTYTVDGVLQETYTLTKTANAKSYQARPEDSAETELVYETFDEYPWKRDIVGGGELIEINSSTPPIVDNVDTTAVSSTVAVKDQTGVDYTVYGIKSTVLPLRTVSEVNRTDSTYAPGQMAIAYKGEFVDLLDAPPKRVGELPAQCDDLSKYMEGGFELYHAGLVQSVLVADAPGFYGKHHRDSLKMWMPVNEHPDDVLQIKDVAKAEVASTTMLGIHPENRTWSAERGWYLDMQTGGTLSVAIDPSLTDSMTMSMWIRPGSALADTRIVKFSPWAIDLSTWGTALSLKSMTMYGTEAEVATGTIARGAFNHVAITKDSHGYTFGIGGMSTAVEMMGTDNTWSFSPIDTTVESELKIIAPAAGVVAVTNQPLDIMFCLDYSNSLAAERAALIANLATFNTALTSVGFDTRYGFVAFGRPSSAPTMEQDLTTFSAVITALSTYVAPAGGSLEFGSAAVIVAGTAAWRTGSQRLVILFTDENDDNGPVAPNEAVGVIADPAIIAKAVYDLGALGARFYYAALLDHLDTGDKLDPAIYRDLATSSSGKGYLLSAFLASPTAMLNDIADLAVDASYNSGGLGLNDIRVWNTVKTESDLEKIRFHNPTKTICPYWPTSLDVAGSTDRHGMRVLDSGFVTLDAMPPAIRMNRMARVTRYNGEGRYQGENRFNEVGLGGGSPLPAEWQMGQQFYGMTATGTVVFCTSYGDAPVNKMWLDAKTPGNYLTLTESGSTWNGIPDSNATYTHPPYPPVLEAWNPSREFVWIKGDDSNVYEVSLHSTPTEVTLVGSIVVRERTDAELTLNGATEASRIIERPTGAQAILASGGYELTCNYGGYVYQKSTGSSLTTPPLYMYLTSNTIEDTSTSSAWSRWTDKSDSSLYGNKLPTPSPALDSNGVLEFENTGDMTTGRYRLTIESGCIGRVDNDFDGFSVLLTVDTVSIEARLLSGKTGADFSGTDVIEFEYGGSNTDNWLLSIQLLNALSDVSRGTQRNLVVYGYKLEKMTTSLYKVSITAGPATAPTLTQIDTSTYTGLNPGGWLAILNSYGTVKNVIHESNVYPENDTVKSAVPLSAMLTSHTWCRNEDHLVVSSGVTVIPDAAEPTMPTFIGIIDR